jgi:hypothetical protein
MGKKKEGRLENYVEKEKRDKGVEEKICRKGNGGGETRAIRRRGKKL